MIDSSVINGNIATGSGEDSIIIQNGSTVNGNIKTGAGNDAIVVQGESTVTGKVDGGTGTNSLKLGLGSSIHGTIKNISKIETEGGNDLVLDQLDTRLDLIASSTATVETVGENTILNMSCASTTTVTGSVQGAGQSNRR